MAIIYPIYLMKKKKIILISEIAASLVLAILLAVAGYHAYRLMGSNFVSRDGEPHYVYVYPETTLDSLISSLQADYTIGSERSLKLHSKLMKWTSAERPFVRTGRYLVPAETANLQLIRMFRSGDQKPIQLTFNNIRTREQLAARLGSQLMIDSASIISKLEDDTYMQQFGLRKETAVCLFLPDTYEMWWDISADQLFKRMDVIHDAFWNADRLAKAAALELTPEEVTTIASIVEEETNRDEDKPIIAGLYMNRLRIGMPMQSCPTVKFALQDFGLRRITNEHLKTESAYNTYIHPGLPPGPIRIPQKKTIDYTLNPTPSNYLYMCASSKFDGTHHFSSSYASHAAYAAAYQRELNRRRIYK